MTGEDFVTFVKDKNIHCPRYPHFDRYCSIDSIKEILFDKTAIKNHAFFPLMHKQLITIKSYIGPNNELKFEKKPREIKYASHIDSWIYLYYSKIINEQYNLYCKENGIENASIAYRDNLHKSTIDFANVAFEFLNRNNCTVIVSDFKSYFDTINHSYLKSQLKKVLQVKSLDDDLYAVLKSVCKYAYVNHDFIAKYKKDKKIKTAKAVLLPIDIIRKHIKISKNKNDYGIPQGLSISAVLANVNMASVDVEINNYVTGKNGIYMRYSDDVFIAIPSENYDGKIITDIKTIMSSAKGLQFNEDKTKKYYIKDRKLTQIKDEGFIHNTSLDYLGFVYQNGNIRVRDKTIYKYTYRLRRKILTYNRRNKKTRYSISKRGIYNTYTSHIDFNRVKNPNIKKHGNYLGYIKRCRRVFKSKSLDKFYFNNIRRMKQLQKRIRNKRIKKKVRREMIRK